MNIEGSTRKVRKRSGVQQDSIPSLAVKVKVILEEDSRIVKKILDLKVWRKRKNRRWSSSSEDEYSPPVTSSTVSPGGMTLTLPAGYDANQLALVLVELMQHRISQSPSHSERELLRKAVHVMQCQGCKNTRMHGKGCEECRDGGRRKGRMLEGRKEKVGENNAEGNKMQDAE